MKAVKFNDFYFGNLDFKINLFSENSSCKAIQYKKSLIIKNLLNLCKIRNIRFCSFQNFQIQLFVKALKIERIKLKTAFLQILLD